jgi:hypothetical protein
MKIKKLNIIGVALLLMLTAFFTSCETWIDPELNEDPNNPVDVTLDLIVPSIMVNMAYDQGGNDAVRTTAIWMQHFDGVARQSFAEGTFVYTPADCNNLWNSTYPNMNDINDVIAKASEVNEDGDVLSPKTRGMAKVLFAEHLAFATNFWGDIPYSEALLGDENTSPKLDSQESIYGVIQTMLDEAITDLEDETGLIGIQGDMIFDGDAESWLATAYGLKARYSLILSKRNGASAYTDAITNANLALTHADASSAFKSLSGFVAPIFIDAGTGANPIYQFMNERGDVRMCATFTDFMSNNNDPRLGVYSGGSGVGSEPLSQNEEADVPGDYVAAIDAPVRFMNTSELHFILAEATFGTDEPAAIAHAQDGIYQSVIEAGIDIDAVDDDDIPLWDNFKSYVENNISTLEDIMDEKWVATYGTVQPFNDWRRTGYPDLTVPADATNNVFPRRYPYAQEEATYNPNVPEGTSIFSRVWWDAE